jgi:hypothetical protein
MTDEDVLMLLHSWRITAEHDGGYVLGRCSTCRLEELLDLTPSRTA